MAEFLRFFAEIAGNARMMGNSVTVEEPVGGALSVIGRDVIVNAKTAGDVRVLLQTLSFGPDAVISRTLTYSTDSKINVPTRVVSEDRVIFEKVSGGRLLKNGKI